MTNNLSEKDKHSLFEAGYWTARKWFTLLVIMLVLWTTLYIAVHSSSIGVKGYEYTKFTTSEIKQISRILNPEFNNAQPKQVNNLIASTTDSNNKTEETTAEPDNVFADCDLPCRINKTELFITGEFDNKIMPDQLDEIKHYINTFGPQEVGIFLVDYKLKVKSYFWLTGPMVYLEIVFWVIIGVLCSLLFAIGNVVRRRKEDEDGFNANEIIYQIAKIFYAPFSAIIIVLTFSYFTDGVTLNIKASEGVIVFAFIAGFYSGRVMGFLDKLKQLLLPADYNNKEANETYILEQLAKEKKPFVNPLLQGETIGNPVAAPVVAMEDIEEPLPEKKQDDKEIGEVDIDLKLDLSGLFDEEKAELQKLGFNRAIVTLHNVNGKDIIPARRNDKNPSRFIANGVKPGIYIARATLSQRLKDDYIINLFGEKTSYVTIDKPGLELFVKKYESVD